ncbi:Isochorismatase family protein [Corynebacterium pseudotuberculosis]|nr:Isochorismatase family protein [Corynebacterium pseudotuberculosis]ALR34232.1 pyrazinamidase / nicotinamidase [Corynebacterium pseudotuberculosis]APX36595.1 nicotinamidase [Corynebacterium pseudotuberculosis]APX37623.1 nicotinamidase [Corynebacterium pseudotuberculosis]ATQ65980.1 Isochorismatase family protein [Corynebacterium pseudotuberculosis]
MQRVFSYAFCTILVPSQKENMRALIIVDVQNDFCPGGALETVKGAIQAQSIAEYTASHRGKYDCIAATKDWHIDPGDHFSQTPDFIDSWPVHCIANTEGADFHPLLSNMYFDEVFYKGHYSAAYSGFEGSTASGELLGEWLKNRGIREIDIAGIATDYCVQATALDGLREGFRVTVLSHLCAAVNEDNTHTVLHQLKEHGCVLV